MKCNLRKIRIRDNIFQSDLAKALNVNQNTISRWESMNRLPGLKKAIQLAKYLNLKVEDVWE